MPDDPIEMQAARMMGGTPEGEGSAATPQDTAKEGVGAADEPVTNEPIPVGGDDAGVGMTEALEPDIEGSRGM